MKQKKIKREETEKDIVPFWNIMDGWDNLSYNKKLEYYWKYEVVDGVRVFDISEGK